MRETVISLVWRQPRWVAWALIFSAVAGCDTDPRPLLGRRAARPSLPQSTPEESFKNIVETMRRAIADQPGMLLSSDDGAFSRLQFHREIRDELIPPDEKNDRYRGSITLVTKYSYRYRPPQEDHNGDDSEESVSSTAMEDPFKIGELPGDPLQALESELSGPMERPRLDRLVPRNLGRDTEDVEENIYELEYVDGRWLVTTRFDPNEDKFMQETFEFALKRQ